MNTLTEQAQRIAGHIQNPMTETELANYLASDNYNSDLALHHLLILFATQNKMSDERKIDEAFLDEMMKRGEKACCNGCKSSAALPDHRCPYHEEFNENSGSLCNCCAKCVQECMNDI